MGDYYGPPPQRPRAGLGLPEWVVIALVASIILPIAFCTGFVRINRGGSTVTLSSSSTSFSPTSAPAPTATPKPVTIHAPVLGGTWPDFENAYGPQLNGERNTWGATIAGQPVQIFADLNSDGHTADGDEHAYVVDLRVPDQFLGVESWDAATADRIAQTFLPADTRHLADVPVSNGLDHRYHSDALAATFASGFFTSDESDAHVDVGTLRYECNSLVGSSSGIEECYISVGTQ